MKGIRKSIIKYLLSVTMMLALVIAMSATSFAESTESDASDSEEEVSIDSVDFDRFGTPDNSDGMADTLSADLDSTTADTFTGYAQIAVIAVGVIVVIASVGIIFLAIRKKGKKSLLFNIGGGAATAVCLVLIIVAQSLANYYEGSINNVFTKTSSASDASITTDESDWKDLVYEIAGEGMVLMKNENNTLPLTSSKVNLLGYYAYNPYYSGSGSSSVSDSDAITIVDSLENAGIEVNPAAKDIYEITEATDAGLGFSETSFSIDEISVDSYTGDASFESMKEYSDTAIVVLGRTGGEGNDLTSYGVVDGTDYLQLNANERDLLEQASDTFEHLIVVLNTGNAMELGFLDEYDIDACIWAGLPGPYGFQALGQILTGEVNPSGKLPDTWVYDNYSAASMENYGDQEATNASGSYYVDYVEGIYVGYKWYETAYAENAVITSNKTGTVYDFSDYYSIVKYPFGYGLSYTTFTQEIVGGSLTDGAELDPRGSYTIEVKVTNTGSVAGKDAVQVYLTAPYTDYDKQNGVEKAAVSLCGIGKTGDIQPGESEIITITFNMEDIASYDSTCDNGDGTSGSYMLDAGEYIFSVRSDSHNVYDQLSASLDEQYFFSGENKRDSDDQAAYNQLADAARGEYLSRQDGFANYDSAMKSVKTTVEATTYEDDTDGYDPAYDTMVDKTYVEGVDYATGGSLTISDMAGLDYDDPLWDELIAQLTLEELQSLVVDTTYTSPRIESIDKSKTCDTDGALGISSMYNPELNGIAYPCTPLLAATFNVDLAYQMGEQVADQCHEKGITGWYAPAMDIHRSAFSGRNFEYYSEDGILSGLMGAAESSGARSKGLIVYIKHFAMNDQETNRASNLHTYLNEQSAREIYLKPFELTVKNGDATAVMNSMNFVGDTYVAVSEAMNIQILRNEWGFRGKVLTDMSYGTSVNAALRAGTDAWLSVMALSVNCETDADIYYLQRAAHNSLYMEANAVVSEAELVNWHIYVYILYAELLVLALACVVSLVLRNTRKKETEAE
ncbi:MAG: glycoside hydrolase family 3 C-terminal domain-containing protein [Lachnospiraceae bacterium]|nr:glycoside hydrolase family 3 C-terminal domain-containing protein [Lachnospiraceae bacterium]